jgi:uncharacterized protein YegP (UPF0339 family)
MSHLEDPPDRKVTMPGSLLIGTFEIFKGDADGLYGFRYRSGYGASLVESTECYTSKEAAMRAIELLQRGARSAQVVDLTQDA